ncbi:MAG: DUF2291 domain-containing protein [Devosia marina]|jgi:predicted lipoprotein
MLSRRGVLVASAALMAASLAGCKIVQIADQEAAAPAGFDAQAYAEELWSDQVLPHFSASARPVAEVIPAVHESLEAAGNAYGYRAAEGSPWAFIVSGTGQVIAKNTESRAGTLDIKVEGLPDSVALQIGPVIRGNAIRDALPFVSFQDFTNQLEYADAGKALTALALQAISPAAENIAVGDSVAFTGAVSLANAADRLQITLVELDKTSP